MVLVAGRVDIQREKRLVSMLAMSVRRWAASVMMAKLCARYPPAGLVIRMEDPHQLPKETRGDLFTHHCIITASTFSES